MGVKGEWASIGFAFAGAIAGIVVGAMAEELLKKISFLSRKIGSSREASTIFDLISLVLFFVCFFIIVATHHYD